MFRPHYSEFTDKLKPADQNVDVMPKFIEKSLSLV